MKAMNESLKTLYCFRSKHFIIEKKVTIKWRTSIFIWPLAKPYKTTILEVNENFNSKYCLQYFNAAWNYPPSPLGQISQYLQGSVCLSFWFTVYMSQFPFPSTSPMTNHNKLGILNKKAASFLIEWGRDKRIKSYLFECLNKTFQVL